MASQISLDNRHAWAHIRRASDTVGGRPCSHHLVPVCPPEGESHGRKKKSYGGAEVPYSCEVVAVVRGAYRRDGRRHRGAAVERAVDGDVSATPAVLDGTVYVPDWTGNIYAVDADTGGRIWETAAQDVTGVPPPLKPSLALAYSVPAESCGPRRRLPATGATATVRSRLRRSSTARSPHAACSNLRAAAGEGAVSPPASARARGGSFE